MTLQRCFCGGFFRGRVYISDIFSGQTRGLKRCCPSFFAFNNTRPIVLRGLGLAVGTVCVRARAV